jgi:hypothetical protein
MNKKTLKALKQSIEHRGEPVVRRLREFCDSIVF